MNITEKDLKNIRDHGGPYDARSYFINGMMMQRRSEKRFKATAIVISVIVAAALILVQ